MTKRLYKNYGKDDLSEIRCSKLKDIRLETQIRGGVVPFGRRDGKVYFFMGLDDISGDYSDFGGGIKSRENELDAAFRELEEESLGVFGKWTKKNCDNMNVIYSDMTFIIMLDLGDISDPSHYVDQFNLSISKEFQSFRKEMRDIVPLDKDGFINTIQNTEKIWSKIRKILNGGIEFIKST